MVRLWNVYNLIVIKQASISKMLLQMYQNKTDASVMTENHFKDLYCRRVLFFNFFFIFSFLASQFEISLVKLKALRPKGAPFLLS
jgi:hypothetical protein